MDLLETLKKLNGYWKYNGGRYLAKLTSGKVSDTFVNCGVLTCRPIDTEIAALNLIYKFMEQIRSNHEDNPFYCDFGEKPICGTCIADMLNHRTLYVGDLIPLLTQHLVTDTEWKRNYPNLYVCGPAQGGITLAYEVARQLGGTAIFTEPKYEVKEHASDSGIGSFTNTTVEKSGQELKRFEIPDGATVLFVEDVITTGKSTREMIRAVMNSAHHSVTALPYVLCLVNRSGISGLSLAYGPDDSTLTDYVPKIISLADINAITWNRLEEARSEIFWGGEITGAMPAFMEEMEAVHPKENWALLTKD